MSKYYKHRNGLVVKWLNDNNSIAFTGVVVNVGGSAWKLKEKNDYLFIEDFTTYTPTPEELSEWGETDTLTNDNPNKVEVDDKDANLRLECLKLAVMSNQGIGHDSEVLTNEATEFYNWITQKP